jgi:hypothetical protein
MANQNPTGDGADERASTTALDLRDQGVVLIHVLTLHPAHLRLAEVVREVTAGSADFEDVDRFQRAVSDLIGVGLLFESAELVLPTRAAIRFNEITEAGL